MSSEKHANLGLHKWAPTDGVLRTEFNDNFAKLDEKTAGIGDVALIPQNTIVDALKDKDDKITEVNTQFAESTQYLSKPTNGLTAPILNGSTDDSGRIQTIINDCISRKKTLVWNGPAYISSSITINGPLKIVGMGLAQILVPNSVNQPFIFNAENIIIENIDFTTTQGVGAGSSYIQVKANNCTITGCTFAGIRDIGISILNNVINTRITGCKFVNLSDGIRSNGAKGGFISENYFTGNSGTEGMNGIKLVHDTTIPNSDPDPQYVGSQRFIITNNIFDGCTKNGIDTFTEGAYTIIQGNIFKGCGAGGMEIKAVYRDSPYVSSTAIVGVRFSRDLIITGNQFIDELNDSYSITMRATDERAVKTGDTTLFGLTVSNNIFSNVKKPVLFQGVKKAIFNSNQIIYGTGVVLLSLDNVSGMSITGNTFAYGVYVANQTFIEVDINNLGSSKNIIVNGNVFEAFNDGINKTKYGIRFTSGSAKISNNVFSDVSQGIVFRDFASIGNVEIINNTFNANDFSITSSSTAGNVKFYTIQGNLFANCGIAIQHGFDGAVVRQGNIFKTVTTPFKYEVNVTNLQKVNEVTIA